MPTVSRTQPNAVTLRIGSWNSSDLVQEGERTNGEGNDGDGSIGELLGVV